MAQDGQTAVRQFIETESDNLLATLRFYVLRSGLAAGTAVTLLTAELLNEVVVEALAHADRFQPDGQPRAWLLGIAANLLKRKQAERAKREQREPLITDLHSANNAMSKGELFDRLAACVTPDATGQLEADETVTTLLNSLAPADRQIVQLAILLEMDGTAVARALNLKPGTARMRLHRALSRLRQAYLENSDE